MQVSLSDQWGNCMYLPEFSVMSLVLQQQPQQEQQQPQHGQAARTHRRAQGATSAAGGSESSPGQSGDDSHPKEWVLMQLRPWNQDLKEDPSAKVKPAGHLVFPALPLNQLEPLTRASAAAVGALLQAGVSPHLDAYTQGACEAGGAEQESPLMEGYAYRWVPNYWMHQTLAQLHRVVGSVYMYKH
jgi:hypothetical protein